MRFSHVTASVAFIASVLGLGGVGYGYPGPIQTVLAATMDAPVYAFGAPQYLKITADSGGDVCKFEYAVTLNGAPVASKGPITATLPWTSADLKLPPSGGSSYSLLLKAEPLPNGCKGQVTLTFAVLPAAPATPKPGATPTAKPGGTPTAKPLGTPAPFATVNGVIGNILTTPAAPKVEAKITGVQAVAELPGNAPRPNSNIFYAGEDFQVDVSGNVSNKNNAQNACGYTVEVVNIKTGKTTNKMNFDRFDIRDVGAIPSPGEYRVHIVPYQFKGGPPACLGKAELSKVTFFPKAAWVTGLKLLGFAYHFNMADAMSMPQFCENCSSIFSPAHDRAFLGIAPTLSGKSPSTMCSYNITQTGQDAPGTIEALYMNGAPASPDMSFPTSLNPPWFNMYNNDLNTITVSITHSNGQLWPSCNILGGKITKTITFTRNPKAKMVIK